MVAAEPASADDMMWRNLRNKLNVVGRVIDGRAQGGAAGECFLQPCSLATPTPEYPLSCHLTHLEVSTAAPKMLCKVGGSSATLDVSAL